MSMNDLSIYSLIQTFKTNDVDYVAKLKTNV